MGICSLCGQKAGWFEDIHAECKTQFDTGMMKIVALSAESITHTTPDWQRLQAECAELAQEAHVSEFWLRVAYARAYGQVLTHYLEDDLLDESEEQHLTDYQHAIGLTQAELDGVGGFLSTMGKAATLRDLMHGKLSTRFSTAGLPALNFQKDEQVLWAFSNCELLEDRIKREFVGKSSGFSVRISKGVYYRVGAFRGTPIERSERTSLDTGMVVMTNKHIYFSGSKKTVRHPYQKF